MAEGNKADHDPNEFTSGSSNHLSVGETINIHGDLNISNGNDEVISDAVLLDNDDFLTKITLYSDNCGESLSSSSLQSGHKLKEYDEKDSINEIGNGNCSLDRNTNSMFNCMFNKDYETLKVLVSEHNIDIDHTFGSDACVEKQNQGWRLLHFVCKEGDLVGLKLIISLGAVPTVKTHEGDTGLHICCRYGHPDVVKYLLKTDDSLKDTKNNDGMSPLLEALCNCPRYDKEDIYIDSVNHLLEAGCNVNHVSDTNMSPLHIAAQKWFNTQVISSLIHAGADVNSVVLGSTPLLEAVKREVKAKIDTDSVKLLIKAGASVNFRDQRGRSPLCYVARYGRLEKKLLNCFLRAGVDKNLDCYKGLDLHFMRVSLDKNLYMLKLLRCYGVHDKESRKHLVGSLLNLAVEYGYEEMVKFFLENGDDPNSKTSDGESALQRAVQSNAVAIADLLISYGADITDTVNFGGTPLLCVAVENMAEETTELLLDKGADINEKSSSGLAAIHYAVYASVFGQNLSITKCLLRRNCDLTSLPYLVLKAIDFGELKAIKLLCEAGCPMSDPFVKINERITALGYRNEYLDWLYNFYHNPRKLQQLCIVNIRRHHGHKLFHLLNTLTEQKVIPMPLIDMILLKDLLK